jgi:glycosyltransferase involved in cell wall biosynthesis
MLTPVSVVTVTYDGFFFVRLLVEKVREFVGPRDYEIIAVDRGSRDGSREWLRSQPDVRLITMRQFPWSRHGHGEAAEAGAREARHEVVILLDSDAHPVENIWLELTADRLDDHVRLAGPRIKTGHRGNPYGWYIHPHFMAFFKADLGRQIILRKLQGHDTDTGEEATIRLLNAGLGVLAYPMGPTRFVLDERGVPTVAAGVFHAWYATRLAKNTASVTRETQSQITYENYLLPLQALLRQAYQLDY